MSGEGIRKAGFVKPHWWDEVFGIEPAEWDYQKSAERYERHNREVLEYFGDRVNRDLLVVCWEHGDGWAELSRFLNKPSPTSRFPTYDKYHAIFGSALRDVKSRFR